MVITTLLENTSSTKELKNKHGICLHISYKDKNILFDLGPDETFIENAKKMNIDIKDVDMVVISHGHKDHGGGLKAFLEYNDKAKIYIHKEAFKEYYTTVLTFFKVYIGLDRDIQDNDRIILTEDVFKIDESLILFSKINKQKLVPSSNKELFIKEEFGYLLDSFKHEQNFILKENNKITLIAGCAHKGIKNIIETGEEIVGATIDNIIGGFHLYNPVSKKIENKDFIKCLGESLKSKNVNFYTLHCTGEKAFIELKEIMGDNISYIRTGDIIEV